MNTDAKKVRERKILDLVYADRHVEEIVPSERPDFIVSSRGGRQFGVEIAELYQSQTTARLDRIPGYSSELLDGGDFRHKDDAQQITVGKIDILTQDNEVKYSQLNAILQNAPSPADCARSLTGMVSAKAEKLLNFSATLSHTNLILHNRTNVLPISSDQFFRLYFLPELQTALAAAHFREVFFLTKMKEGAGFVPLKMLFLVAEAYFFNAIYTATEGSRLFATPVAELEVLGSYLATVVKGPVLFRDADEGSELIYGDSGFFLARDGSVAIRMYWDEQFPNDAHAPAANLAARLGSEFTEKLLEHKSAGTFVMPLLFPTKQL
jgi:hypothetical protein